MAAGTSGTDFAVARYWGDQGPPQYARTSPNAVYINQLFQDLLGRPVGPARLSGNLRRLTIYRAGMCLAPSAQDSGPEREDR